MSERIVKQLATAMMQPPRSLLDEVVADAIDLSSRHFSVADLMGVLKAPPPDDPPLACGDLCRLNSGGPDMLVFAVSVTDIGVTFDNGLGGTTRHSFPRGCVRRVT